MEPETKFKLTTFLKYLFLEPWTEKVSLPNVSSIVWVFIVISLIIKNVLVLWISIAVGIIFYIVKEYKSGKYIYWYRNRNKEYVERKEALKKIRREKENNKHEEKLTLDEPLNSPSCSPLGENPKSKIQNIYK